MSHNETMEMFETIARLEAENKELTRALENTVETLNDVVDSHANTGRFFYNYSAFEQRATAAKQLELRICNHNIRLPHECRDCFDILCHELEVAKAAQPCPAPPEPIAEAETTGGPKAKNEEHIKSLIVLLAQKTEGEARAAVEALSCRLGFGHAANLTTGGKG